MEVPSEWAKSELYLYCFQKTLKIFLSTAYSFSVFAFLQISVLFAQLYVHRFVKAFVGGNLGLPNVFQV